MSIESKPSILAFAPNWIGDAAMCTPALRALARRFPAYRLEIVARPPVCALLEELPWLHGFHSIPPKGDVRAFLDFAFALRRGRPAITVVFPHSFRAALLAAMSGAARRAGYARNGRSFLLTHAPSPYREQGRIVPIYMSREYLTLVETLGCEDDGHGLELRAHPEDIEHVRTHLGTGGPIVAIAPGAAFGPAKRWLPERFAAVADALVERKRARCVLLTGPGEEDTRAAVRSAARHPLLEIPTSPRGGIPTLKAIVSQCDLLIGNDSGPRHIAIAFDKPVVCVMGPTRPEYTQSPWEKGRILRVNVDCGPCQKPVCETDHRCMTGISAQTVLDTARTLLPE